MIHGMVKNRLVRRRYSIRKRVVGTAERPRLCVRRSEKHIYALLVDDAEAQRRDLGLVAVPRNWTKAEGTKSESPRKWAS